MFKHVGKKIQAVCLIVFFVGVMVAFASGFAVGYAIYESTDEMALAVMVAGAVICLSVLIVWLSVLLIFAFGKIEEHCEEQCNLLKILVANKSMPVSAERICTKCGTKLEVNAKFCATCGTHFENSN